MKMANEKCPKCGAKDGVGLNDQATERANRSLSEARKRFDAMSMCLDGKSRQLAASESRYRDLAEAMGVTVHQPHEAIVDLALQGQHADTALAAALERAEKAEAACAELSRLLAGAHVWALINSKPSRFDWIRIVCPANPGQALLDELNRLRASANQNFAAKEKP
jgi:hypothetical protein